jgi:uncharacterized membrane protein YqjE
MEVTALTVYRLAMVVFFVFLIVLPVVFGADRLWTTTVAGVALLVALVAGLWRQREKRRAAR